MPALNLKDMSFTSGTSAFLSLFPFAEGAPMTVDDVKNAEPSLNLDGELGAEPKIEGADEWKMPFNIKYAIYDNATIEAELNISELRKADVLDLALGGTGAAEAAGGANEFKKVELGKNRTPEAWVASIYQYSNGKKLILLGQYVTFALEALPAMKAGEKGGKVKIMFHKYKDLPLGEYFEEQ